MANKKVIETYFVPGFLDLCSGLPIARDPNFKGHGFYGHWIARLKHDHTYWYKGVTESQAVKKLIGNLHFEEHKLERINKQE